MQGYSYERKDSNEDQELWEGVINGNRNALGHLFDIYAKELLNYGYRISGNVSLTKDAIQDVFVDIWSYRANLSQQVQVKFYLYRCVRRAVVKQMADQNTLQGDLSEVDHFFLAESSPEMQLVALESENLQNDRVQRSLSLLSDREREVISLKYYSDMKIREIAQMLDLKEQTIANTLQNALTKLRKNLVHILILCQFLI